MSSTLNVARCPLWKTVLLPGALFAALLGWLVLAPTGRSADAPSTIAFDEESSHVGFKVYKKVVTIRPTKRYDRAEDFPRSGHSVPPFSIFFLAKQKAGDSKDLVQIATMDGKPLGWLPKKDTQIWNTRYVIEPERPQKDRFFSFKTRIKDKEEEVRLKSLPERGTHRAFGFVQKKLEGNDTYELFFCTGPMKNIEGSMVDTDPIGKETKLEIVFVLESSDFMNKPFPGDPSRKPLIDYLKAVVDKTVAEVTSDPKKKKAVRFGFVQFWDNVPWRENDKRMELVSRLNPQQKEKAIARLKEMSPRFPAAVGCELTSDVEQFRQNMNRVTGTNLHDDWADDGIAGLNEAVSTVKWGQNSIKHIILIGSASFHLGKPGSLVNQFYSGPENLFTRMDVRYPRGYSKTGLSIEALISRAQPAGGGNSFDLTPRYFHALFLPNEHLDPVKVCSRNGITIDETKMAGYRDRLVQVFAAADEEAKKLDAQLMVALQNETGSREKAETVYQILKRAQLVNHQAELARSQYRQLIRNRSGGEGLFIEVGPTADDVNAASSQLSRSLLKSIRAIADLRADRPVRATDAKDPLVLPIWRLRKDIEDEFLNQPIALGTARLTNAAGDDVANEKVMVSRIEMKRFAGIFKDWYDRFSELEKAGNRDDTKQVIRTIQESLTKFSYGQGDKQGGKATDASLPEKTLAELLGDLPMRSPAMKLRAKDLAVMSKDKFGKWLARLKEASEIAQRLYDDPAQWSLLTQGAVPGDDKYGFFPLHTLP